MSRPVSKEDGLGILIEGLAGGDTSRAIEAQEARGQQSFVASDTLPIDGTKPQRAFFYDPEDRNASRFETLDEWLAHDDVAWFAEQGFELGPVVPGDDQFRYARLPAGWSKTPTDHSMWSHIMDDRGRERCAVFYKAAFYDRRARISITPLCGPIRDLPYADHDYEPDEESRQYLRPGEEPWCGIQVDGRQVCNRAAAHRWHHPEADVPTGDFRTPVPGRREP